MPYVGKKPADIIATAVDTTTGTFSGAFTSQGIDDNANATAITIDSNEDITITKQGTNTTDLRFANSTNDFGGNIKYDHNSGIMKFDVHNSERMTINASGKVGIGDSSPLGNKVHIRTGGSASSVNATAGLVLEDDDSTRCDLQFIGPDGTFQSILFGDVSDDDIGKIAYSHTGNSMRFTVNASERMRIDSSGNLGLGTSSPDSRLDVATGANGAIFRYDSASTFLQILPEDANGDISLRYRANSGSAPDLLFKNDGGTEQLRLTNNGDLLVNTTTDTSGGFSVQTISNNTTSTRMLAHGFSVRNNWGSATNLGEGIFSPAGSALAFSTASTERMRIDSSGNLLFNLTNRLFSDTSNTINASVNGSSVLRLNRGSDAGSVVQIGLVGISQGTISISGTTVSYNGGHISRWSRLLDNSKDTSIVKGTVMTNLDEMVEWGDEDNEQLNKMAVSSVEGDANVAGVFVNWDNDDDWNDMNVAMTGDMVIRIAKGTTIARGDLLMSAGDGTAKPQGDDIVRSKTIAKVTSTNKSHTYDDGTYLVPCVLMAC